MDALIMLLTLPLIPLAILFSLWLIFSGKEYAWGILSVLVYLFSMVLCLLAAFHHIDFGNGELRAGCLLSAFIAMIPGIVPLLIIISGWRHGNGKLVWGGSWGLIACLLMGVFAATLRMVAATR